MIQKLKQLYFNHKNQIYYILCFLFLVLYFVTRLYRLMGIPRGLHTDEVGMAYDAWSLANYGVDRWGIEYPVYLRNFGGGQSALYAYLSMILIKLFGYSDFMIRIPAVLMGFLLLVFSCKIAKECFESKKAVILTGVFVVTLPYFLMAERWALDCNLLCDVMVIFIYYLIRIIKEQKIRDYVFAGIVGGLSLYCYAIAYIMIPLILFGFLTYGFAHRQISLKKLFALGIPVSMLAFPLIAMLLVNHGFLEPFQIMGFTVIQLPNFRGGELSIRNVLENIGIIKILFTHDHLIYNAFPKYLTLYLISLIVVPIGILSMGISFVKSCNMRKVTPYAVPFIALVSVVLTILVVKEPNINKANAFYGVIIIFLVGGVLYLLKIKQAIFSVVLFVYFICFLFFSRYYYTKYETDCYPQYLFNDNFSDVVDYVTAQYQDAEEKTIYINTQSVTNPYIYIMLEEKIPYTELKSDAEVGRYQMLLPNYDYDNGIYQMEGNPDDLGIYVIQGNEGLDEKLKNADFSLEEYNGYHIFYK